MIETFCEKLIEELGATGILVIGLYFMLYKPLTSMARHLHKINDEIGQIITILKDNLPRREV